MSEPWDAIVVGAGHNGLTCAAYPAMRARGYGRIVNISSATFFIGYAGLSAYIASKGTEGKPDRGAIETMMPRVREQLSLLERTVAASCYLVGERFTLADINLLPIMFYISRMPETAEAFAAGTALRRYYDTHAARPSFVRTVPPLSPPRRVVAG